MTTLQFLVYLLVFNLLLCEYDWQVENHLQILRPSRLHISMLCNCTGTWWFWQ